MNHYSKYLVINILFVIVVYYGFYQHNQIAYYLALVMGWVTAIAGVIAFLFLQVKEIQNNFINGCKTKKMYKNFPVLVLDVIYDLAVAFIFAINGFQILSFLYILEIGAIIMMYKLKPQKVHD